MSDKPKLSIILPAIRRDRWVNLYNSLLGSCTKYPFELIIVGPYAPPPEFDSVVSVKYVKDFGSPTRCSNIGAMLVEGEIVTWTSDDATYFPNSIDQAIDHFESLEKHPKNVVLCKYLEGQNGVNKQPFPDWYFKINNGEAPYCNMIPREYWLFNLGFMYTSYFNELGGWDSQFQVTAIAHQDFGVRAQLDGARVHLINLQLMDCDHMPDRTGDHGPIHDTQLGEDQPRFKEVYQTDYTKRQIHIPMDNWKQADIIWKKRFGG